MFHLYDCILWPNNVLFHEGSIQKNWLFSSLILQCMLVVDNYECGVSAILDQCSPFYWSG